MSTAKKNSLVYSLHKQGTLGTATVTENGELSYLPNDNASGTDQIEIKITDAAGAVEIKIYTFTLGEEKTNALGMTFRLIHPGEFWMGSSEDEAGRLDEGPRHRVSIGTAFWLQTTPVTQRQYEMVLGSNPSHFKNRPDHPVEES